MTAINTRDVLLQATSPRVRTLPNAAIILKPSTNTFHVNSGGANDPASITFAYNLIYLDGPATFSCTGGTITTAGNVATLTYSNMSAATAVVTASVVVNGTTFSDSCVVSKVYDGTNGINNTRVYAFQRAASAPTGTPGDITVTFASNSITAPAALLNGWVRDIPTANGNPLYVVAISGAGTGATVNLLSAGWSGAAVMATDGPGGTGTNGTNGLNSATITIYQRSASATALALPSAATTYTFASGVIAGLNNGWTQGVPANDPAKPYLQTSLATAISASATDTVASSEWATAQLLYDAAAVISAQTTANNAATSAQAALDALAIVAADGYLSMGEKPAVIKEWLAIDAEITDLVNQASSLGVSSTALGNAKTLLDAYLNGLNQWSVVTVDTVIVPATFKLKFNDYYAARVTLLNAVSAKIQANAVVAGTTSTWAGTTGLGKPSDNATSDITLITTGTGITLSGNTVTRTGGSTWDAQAYTPQGYVGGASVSFQPEPGSHFMMGLDSNPAQDSSYGNIDFAFYSPASSNLYFYESGYTDSVVIGTYAAGDVCSITYDGTNVYYMINRTVVRTRPAAVVGALGLDSSFVSGTVRNIRLVPLSGNYAAAGKGAALNSDPACAQPSQWDLPNGSATASFITITDGSVGNTAIRSSGAANVSKITSKLFPMKAGRVYKISMQIRSPGGVNTANYMRIIRIDSTGGGVGYLTGYEATRCASTSWVTWTYTITAEAGTAQGIVELDLNWDPALAAPVDVQDVRVEDVTDVNAAALTSTWSGTSGTGKPADYATVGAPAGTYVAGTLAESVVSNASTALTNASTALTNAGTAQTAANTANNVLNNLPVIVTGGNISIFIASGGGAKNVGVRNSTVTGGTAPFVFTYSMIYSLTNLLDINMVITSSGTGYTDNNLSMNTNTYTAGEKTIATLVITCVDAKGFVAVKSISVTVTSN